MPKLPNFKLPNYRNLRMTIEQKITDLLNPYLENDKFFLVNLKVSASRINTKITILLDSDEGIKIDECAAISRKLGNDLEEQNVMPNAYNLEISSPGIDTPLKFLRQYNKNIGRTLRVILKDGIEKVGELQCVDNQTVTLIEERKKKAKKNEIINPLVIFFEQIKEAYVQISFK